MERGRERSCCRCCVLPLSLDLRAQVGVSRGGRGLLLIDGVSTIGKENLYWTYEVGPSTQGVQKGLELKELRD